jgi:hypothetical protein
MDLLNEECDIVDADMHNWEDAIEIKGIFCDTEITISANFKEVKKDGN